MLKELDEANFPMVGVNRKTVCFAILHLAKGDLAQFRRLLAHAGRDWRDILIFDGLCGAKWREVLTSRGIALDEDDEAC